MGWTCLIIRTVFSVLPRCCGYLTSQAAEYIFFSVNFFRLYSCFDQVDGSVTKSVVLQTRKQTVALCTLVFCAGISDDLRCRACLGARCGVLSIEKFVVSRIGCGHGIAGNCLEAVQKVNRGGVPPPPLLV